jgi:hypothetical protein
MRQPKDEFLAGGRLTLLWDYFPLARDSGQSAHCFVKLLLRNLGFFNIVAEDFTNYGR